MKIELPEFACIVLIGKDNKEKRGFIHLHFNAAEVISLNAVQNIGAKRLEEGLLTAVESEALEAKAYEELMRLSRRYHCMTIAIIFDFKESSLENLGTTLEKNGFHKVYRIASKEQLEVTQIVRVKLPSNQKAEHGPFDLIGDIHGCYDELCELLEKLDYQVDRVRCEAKSLHGRKVVFLGDLVDRGPKNPEVLRLVMSMVKRKEAYCTLGNHDGKLLRKLKGANVQVIHGLGETLAQLEKESPLFIEEVRQFLETLVSHYVFDEGNLVAVHAGLKEKFHGRESKKIRDLAMFGETTGKMDELGLPIRLAWYKDYKGKAFVVYGHTPQAEAKIINHTINIDTGCVFGGKLTAIRYPEKEIVSVAAKQKYCEPARPFL